MSKKLRGSINTWLKIGKEEINISADKIYDKVITWNLDYLLLLYDYL